MTAEIVFGVSGWCRLLAHACTAGELCGCECHRGRRGAPRPSTALPSVLHTGENVR